MKEVPCCMLLKSFARKIVPTAIWNKARLWRLKSRVRAFPKRVVRHCYMGFNLDVHLEDPLAAGWYDNDWSNIAPFALMKNSQLRPGARVFYLGAHQGVAAMLLSCIIGKEGSLIAVEANPHNADVARRNAERNKLSQMHVINAAAASSPGHITVSECLNAQIDDGSEGWGCVKVPAVSVDQLSAEHGRPDVLVIDVEGYECQVLMGARKTLAHLPDCWTEIHVGCGLEKFGGSWQEVLSYFPESSYERLTCARDGEGPYLPMSSESIRDRRFFVLAMPHKTKAR
ncbi:MAG TPA: FkbM family methyltransferase [Planctomycetota bacterium]|nr:FkbM family methyltransferase [Planctomycetota bacterium]